MLRKHNFVVFIAISILLVFHLSVSTPTTIRHPNKLQCEQFNLQECNSNGTCEPIIEECVDDDPDKPSNCFVLWSINNVTGESDVHMKGCFTDNVSCNQTECVDNTNEKKNKMLFCCCKNTLCNMQHKWIPTSTVAPEIKHPEPDMTVMYVLYGCILLILSMTVAGVSYYVYRRRKQAMFDEIPTIEPEISVSSQCLVLRPIQLIEMKAHGRFGTVWKGLYKTEEVAVKIFPMHEKQSWVTEQEIYKLPRMTHPNILYFVGAEKHVETSHTDFWLITTYQPNGSLCDYLKSHTVTWPELCKIGESMARGLQHLHEEIAAGKSEGLKPALAHRDFKSKNVLLKDDLTACIADFGLALVFTPGKPCGDTHGQVGTRRYMAPEILEGAINFTRDAFLRIDVYACGLVLWELVSRCTAHGGPVAEYVLPFEAELGTHPSLEEMQENVVMKKLRPTLYKQWKTHSGLNAMCDTIEECWDHDAEARLSSSCVMERVAQHTKYPQKQLLIETNTDNLLKNSNDSM